MLRYDQQLAGETPFGVDLVTPDFGALAGSFGVPADRVEGFGREFERVLRDSIAAGEPAHDRRPRLAQAAARPPHRAGIGRPEAS